MNLPFFIAKKYFFSRKSPRAVNIISIISVIAVAFGTSALIIVLSVFNGFETLVKSLYNSFDPDIKITSAEGKTFSSDIVSSEKLKKIQGVNFVVPVIEENALIRYHDKQYIATIKGVTSDFTKMSGLDTMMTDGQMLLQNGDTNFAVVGSGIAYNLNLNIGDFQPHLDVFVPRREVQVSLSTEEAFNRGFIMPAGIFSIQQDFDTKYILVPLRFAHEMTGYEKNITALEIGLKPDADKEKTQAEIKTHLGNNFLVRDRFQQHELLYKIMRSEKWAVYLILTLILIIAIFNLAGSLTMLILSKQKDISVLQSMGAPVSLIRKIFLGDGMMITFSGAAIGIVLGWFICWLQLRYGFVPLGSSGSFVISRYPVEMQLPDFIYVLLTVLAIGFAAAWYPTLKVIRKSEEVRLVVPE
ncbi:MAG TPA: FtsX-like permease family protein [Bacteroidia bacterium]|nr:FtsX-like permease family protein [Bacteroidia bacterium]